MSLTASETKSGKGHTDENFPVASHLIAARHRPAILAYYRFARAADDVSDNTAISGDEKLRLLDGLEASLTGSGPADPEVEPLKRVLAERNLPPRHAIDLLHAFRLDARKNRTADWADLMHYCSLSAMPVGRFVLDVHGEDAGRTYPASDALCAALQVINHLQDCGKDYRDLDRVYLPDDLCAAAGARIEDLARPAATPALLTVIRDLNERTAGLLRESQVFASVIADTRLGLEVAVIQRLAEHLVGKLSLRDPLGEKVHASKSEAALVALSGVAQGLWRRAVRRAPAARLGAAG